jgi:uncharacterized protein (TIGR02118 family)
VGGEHQRRSRIRRELGQGLAELPTGLALEQALVERRLRPMVDKPAEEPGGDRTSSTAIDHEVGRHAVQPGPRLFRRAPAAKLVDEPDERLADDVLGGLGVAFECPDEGRELPMVRVVQLENGAPNRLRPIERPGTGTAHGQRHGRSVAVEVVHTHRTAGAAMCCRFHVAGERTLRWPRAMPTAATNDPEETMTTLLALFRRPDGGLEAVAEFERRYATEHLPLVADTPGLRSTRVQRVAEALGGETDLLLITAMQFDDRASLDAGLASDAMRAAGRNLRAIAPGLSTLLVLEDAPEIDASASARVDTVHTTREETE